MPKDNGSTNKSISNSQKAKGAKLARQAKLGIVKLHGGTCSSCGQCSTSCTPNTHHDGCTGYFQGDFGSTALNKLAERSQSHMLFDGSPIQRPVFGSWVDGDSLATLLDRRAERASEAGRILRNQTHIVPITEEVPVAPIDGVPTVRTKVTGVKFENGMGEAVAWLDGKYVRTVDLPAYMDDPIPPELVSLDEDDPATMTDTDAILLAAA